MLDKWGIMNQFPARVTNFFLLQSLQASAWAHPAVHSSVSGALPLGVKQLGHEADHSPVYEVTCEWNYTSNTPCDFTARTRTSSFDNTKVTFMLASLSIIWLSTFSLPMCHKNYSRQILPYQQLSRATRWWFLAYSIGVTWLITMERGRGGINHEY